MRRSPIVIAATIAGTVGVLTFKPHDPSFAASLSPPAETTSPERPSSSSATQTTPVPTASATQNATGDSIATQYGPVQVKVTVKDGTITDVVPLALTGDDPKSAQISASAAPSLLQSALTKQTAAIDAVSGATVTSAGYEASLQSALDKIDFQAADGSRGSSTIPQVQEHDGPGGH